MDELLHPAQLEAVEKLKRLKVGALNIDRQDGKLRTIAALIRYRMRTQRIDSVIWLCTGRKEELLAAGVAQIFFRYGAAHCADGHGKSVLQSE